MWHLSNVSLNVRRMPADRRNAKAGAIRNERSICQSDPWPEVTANASKAPKRAYTPAPVIEKNFSVNRVIRVAIRQISMDLQSILPSGKQADTLSPTAQ